MRPAVVAHDSVFRTVIEAHDGSCSATAVFLGLSLSIAMTGVARSRPGWDQRRVSDADGDFRGRGRVEPIQHRAHLVAADGHTSPGGIAIGHVEKDPSHPSRDALRVYRDVDGVVVDGAGVIEVFRYGRGT